MRDERFSKNIEIGGCDKTTTMCFMFQNSCSEICLFFFYFSEVSNYILQVKKKKKTRLDKFWPIGLKNKAKFLHLILISFRELKIEFTCFKLLYLLRDKE